ncbi:MAG: low molecular weight phosphotyrosine protein phosphatase [Ruminococcaceae bacterium]|nr:low molecular weight phosphotyrosine protein phosphatase [Oscillospiraceae bacterium]
MTRICFVCHGNICRSPMAEFIMKDLVKKAGFENEFHIESRATHTDEIWNGTGSPIYPPAREQLKSHCVPYSADKRAKLLQTADRDNFDYFIGMDAENNRYMLKILGHSAKDKIFSLLEFAGESRSVSDPWYTGNFDLAFNDILKGCTALRDKLCK